MGFAESFIEGYSKGTASKRAKEESANEAERLKLAKETAAAHQKAVDSDLKLRKEEFDARQARDAADETLKMNAYRRTMPTPTTPVSEGAGGVGPPAPDQGFDEVSIGGKTFKLPRVYQEEAQAQDVSKARALESVRDEPVNLTIDIPGVAKKGTPIRPSELTAAVSAQNAREMAQARRDTAAKSQFDINDPQVSSAVNDAADRVAAGEITLTDARGLLGGVKGGLGTHLLHALGDRRALPTKVRVELQTIKQSHAAIDQVEQLVRDVQGSHGAQETVENSLLLEQYLDANATNLAKGYGGEVGRVTDQDVVRVKRIFPGWKAANFAPGYVEKELKAIRDGLNRREKAVTGGYFREIDKAGNITGPKGAKTTPEDELAAFVGGR